MPPSSNVVLIRDEIATKRGAAPFRVLAVAKCKAGQPLLQRILDAGPRVELRTCPPDTAQLAASWQTRLPGVGLGRRRLEQEAPHEFITAG